ncbi:P-loop NTPase fold protein [Streptomyces sp. NPDC101178]|uniref:P-loop NTPase fold protein n=1 Tax=Streptomyces sp. NPDC101178 TaxID=3366124 RepID=UPI00381A4411
MLEIIGPGEMLWVWDHEGDEERYDLALRTSIEDQEIKNKLKFRERVTEEALQQAALKPTFIAEVFELTQSQYRDYRRAVLEVDRSQEDYRLARAELTMEKELFIFLSSLAGILFYSILKILSTTGLPDVRVPLLAHLALVLLTALPVAIKRRSRQNARHAAHVLNLRIDLAILRFISQQKRSAWDAAIVNNAMLPLMRAEVDRLMGDDQTSLFDLEDHGGLRGTLNPQFLVPTPSERHLRQKMDQIEGGTIAVCGPRGAGKSTLLRSCTESRGARFSDLTVFVQAPAEYAPQEFLLMLFGKVCQAHLQSTYSSPRNFDEIFFKFGRKSLRDFWHFAMLVLLFLCGLFLLGVGLVSITKLLYGRYLRSDIPDRISSMWERIQNEGVSSYLNLPPHVSIGCATSGVLILILCYRARRVSQTLEQECRRYLYRLRTVQSSTNALNLGLPAVRSTTMSGSRTSSIPFNLPELVSEFRELLMKISQEAARADGRVIIAIDELDRLGDVETARRFLAQIKAVFGIRGVYYLVSVAEDVGAAFVRRGLPNRDVTDSSLDDLLYLQPRTAEESAEILAVRAPSLTAPYCLLLHSLSGGIPRDLIRYARRLLEVHHWTERTELRDLAPQVILEELAETLEGFRTLLAFQDQAPDGGPLLHRLLILVRSLRSPRQNDDDTTSKIESLALSANLESFPEYSAEVVRSLGITTLELWQEISAYAYYSLTLLQIFGAPSFDSRYKSVKTRLNGSIDGDLQRLAEARLELAVSPYSARLLLDDIRVAWDLPPSDRPE